MRTRTRTLAAALAVAATVALTAPAAAAADSGRSDRPASLSLPGASGASGADVSELLTSVLTDVDAYWTRIFEDHGYREPTVTYSWISQGRSVIDGCSGQPTDDLAAFYCPNDDTIYLAESFAAALRDGQLSGWPSGDEVDGALGDMAVAYVVAHEEAHNIQDELGLFDGSVSTTALELHADCLAGAWAADADRRGLTTDDDVTEARVTAWLVGDYEVDNPGHHGTPAERRDAFSAGYTSLSGCRTYLR